MPFDINVETPVMRRSILAEALRHPLVNWEWDFSQIRNECNTAGCALGYAMKLWPKALKIDKTWGGLSMTDIGEFFGMTADQTYHIFEPVFWNQRADNVTPAMVADRLDAITGP